MHVPIYFVDPVPAVRYAAQRLQKVGPQAEEPQLMGLCALGLLEFAERYQQLEHTTKTAARFIRQLVDMARICADEEKTPAQVLHDRAFYMFECLAAILLEEHLRQPTRQMSEAQGDLLYYFRECGHWRKEDRSEITDFFFIYIPEDVAQDWKRRGAENRELFAEPEAHL